MTSIGGRLSADGSGAPDVVEPSESAAGDSWKSKEELSSLIKSLISWLKEAGANASRVAHFQERFFVSNSLAWYVSKYVS